ncbi:type II toxin-antitoxin system RelE/ParE family toxin [Thalassospira sp.]|uniref:type II toxin-antitoxin system RelE/ParE family toxin n=1 Tax=Thalassospira sp. TaxID=1912094 RepID=UPI00273281DF|nr:type II toxin-antitoxin system RelE/ParE family toxin [Thalassospira sp.]MDP2698705.1 type II toxin-antitoxin system RelE/ParE family toxin [Thalassospira sp.]
MTYLVRWSRDALDDIREQVRYIGTHNLPAARKVAQRLRQAGNDLTQFNYGRKGPLPGTFEKILPDLPYIIVYQPDEASGCIFILRLLHSRQNRPEP